MMSGDEFYDDDVTSGIDWRDVADFERKRLRESSECFKCGSPDPAILRVDGCSDCDDPRPFCPTCRRYTDRPKTTSWCKDC